MMWFLTTIVTTLVLMLMPGQSKASGFEEEDRQVTDFLLSVNDTSQYAVILCP